MLNTVRSLLVAAVGAVDLTEDKVRTIVDDLVRRGTLAADEAKAVLAEWAQASTRRQSGLDDRIRASVEEALGRYNVASHASVVALEARLVALEDAVLHLAAPKV